ncbi:MAG: cysteine desulfurase [Chthoniobacterales bacterium]|nr:cysteine desulfurase [Chthoniobacterales bacterium]
MQSKEREAQSRSVYENTRGLEHRSDVALWRNSSIWKDSIMIYLDYNATTPLCQEALEAMLPWLQGGHENHGNPSSIHAPGRKARAAIDEARDQWAQWLQAKSHEIIFTAGGTESDNLALLGLARRHDQKGNHLITASTEHHAVLHAMETLRDREGFKLTILPVQSDGMVDPERLREALRPETILVSIMETNNETGVIQPIAELAAICRERGVFFHTDAVQSFGKRSCLPMELGVDALSLAAHKFYGPKGVGVLWLRSGVSINAIQHGGFQENERRPGTEDVASIVGMTAAAKVALQSVAQGVEARREEALRKQLWEGIKKIYPLANRHGTPEQTLFNTLNVSFPHTDGETLIMGLDLEGIAVSSGSACMVGSVQASHVLQAMGVSPKIAQTAVRFSLGRGTTTVDIEGTLLGLEKVLKRQHQAATAMTLRDIPLEQIK